MSYRGVKRVLGETNLEWKCRILFGICLLLLVTGAFWFAQQLAEGLVRDRTRQSARDFADLALMQFHYENWETDTERRELAKQMNEDLKVATYQWQLLAFDPTPTAMAMAPTAEPGDEPLVQLPSSKEETDLLWRLEQRLQQQMAGLAGDDAATPDAPDDAEPFGDAGLLAPGSEVDPVYDQIWLPELREYHYYQVVYWTESCDGCHNGLQGQYAVSAGDAAELFDQGPPLRVVKVVIPDDKTQRAIDRTWAFLLATAIVTVFLAMVALYVVVRYVIVKPLQHLRDVSDEISRGNLDLRADIHTNDEFEDLAESFNRMLRHLIDAQKELRGLNVDLDAKVDELARVNMQLYEMNRLKSDFLANMSHELRTPLNSIIGFSEVLEGIEQLDDKQVRYVQNIRQSGRVLLEMINDILDLAKMESGKSEVRPTEFRVGAVVRGQCDMVRSLTEEKNIDLDVDIPADLPPMYQDQSKVQQILTNLLSNAIKFTPEGGRIGVSVVRDGRGEFELTVADTGVGIAEEDREVIFEKFRQGSTVLGSDNLTRSYSGTGLGLSIVKELARLLDGQVAFDSELGKGSTFTVTLPWSYSSTVRLDSPLSAKLNELTKPRRGDFQHAPTDGAADQDASPPTSDAPTEVVSSSQTET